MANRLNLDVAGRLEEAARLLKDQGADAFRVGRSADAAHDLLHSKGIDSRQDAR